MKTVMVLMAVTGALVCSCGPRAPKSYPAAARTDAADVYFGDTVADPYRWMENDSSESLARWVSEQNHLTRGYLDRIPFRERLYRRMMALSDCPKRSMPVKKGGKYYFFLNSGLQNQSVLYSADSADDPVGTVVLDPNTLSDSGTAALADISFSSDGTKLAYCLSRNGSDWREIYVLDLLTGRQLEDHIKWCKFSSAAWCGDGFFYSAYDRPGQGSEFVGVNEGHKVYYHKLGTPQAQDRLVYENRKYPQRFYSVSVSDDERLLFLHEDGMSSGNMLYVMDLSDPHRTFRAMTEDCESSYVPVYSHGKDVYLYTNWGADNYRIMKACVSSPRVDAWKELVAESKDVLSAASVCAGKLFLVYDRDVANRVEVRSLEGEFISQVPLPSSGTVAVSGSAKEDEVFFTYASFLTPGTIYRYSVAKDSLGVSYRPQIDFDASQFETKQVYYTSADGTPVPMYLTYRKGLKLNGKNPVFMTGYGGFNISLYPSFSPYCIPFVEAGGIYVQTNLRGGGEFGRKWHMAGTRLDKQNVFDDFIAAARYLVANGYTSKGCIGISGGSNGGLLIGACVNQAPELFGAAVPRVGVMDMLRYHLFTIGWNWAPDYGTSAESEQMYRYLKAYSPLHNISDDGTVYPPIMVTTADHDDRVVPAHSFKYAATLQWSDTGNAPKLIRVDTDAGHGAGKPVTKVIQEQADIYAFIMYNLGMTYER